MKVRERVILGLCVAMACLFIAYGFFMEKTIANTVALSAMQSTIVHENQKVSTLSGSYVALSSNVTLDSALAEGFVEAPIAAFVTIPAPAAENPALSVNIGAGNAF